MLTKKKCINLATSYSEYEPSNEEPDEDCINCILDDILNTKEGETRDAWIELYRKGLMLLNCSRTGKSYIINQDFFNRIYNY